MIVLGKEEKKEVFEAFKATFGKETDKALETTLNFALDCIQFWYVSEDKTSEEAVQLGLKEMQNLNGNPFSPKGGWNFDTELETAKNYATEEILHKDDIEACYSKIGRSDLIMLLVKGHSKEELIHVLEVYDWYLENEDKYVPFEIFYREYYKKEYV